MLNSGKQAQNPTLCEKHKLEIDLAFREDKPYVSRSESGLCSLCDEPVPLGVGIFCPEHELLGRNYDRYKRQLDLENKCHYCETKLPDKVHDGRPHSHTCSSCIEKQRENFSRGCFACLGDCCSCGREMERDFHGVRMEVRFELCMECVVHRSEIAAGWDTSESYGERALYKILTELFGDNKIYRYLRPWWLHGLELDFFVPNESLAFEFDGQQHFKEVPHFHREDGSFARQQSRDAEKERLCKQQAVRLIRIKYDDNISLESIRSLIAS